MELQFSRTMLIVFVVTITAVLIEFNSTADITARRPKHVPKPRNEWKTKTTRTMNAGYVNTMQKPNSEEGVKWIYPESGINTKKTTAGTKSQAGTNMGKDEFSTTDNSIKDTKNKQENSTVPTMHSAYSTNSYLATNDLTAFSHHQDNSEHVGTIVGLTVSLIVVVTVVGLVFLCYYKKFLCFKSNEKCDLERSYIPMLIKTIKTSDEPVDGNVVLNVDVENINMPDTTEDEVDISSAKTNSPVCVYEYTSKYNNIQPTSNDENVKVLATCI